jgi:hypothetical protein
LRPGNPVKPACDWSRLDASLRDLAKSSTPSACSSGLAVEPQVTLAHDPRDPLEAFEQFSRDRHEGPSGLHHSSEDATASEASGAAQTAIEPAEEPRSDPLELLALLAAIPAKQS